MSQNRKTQINQEAVYLISDPLPRNELLAYLVEKEEARGMSTISIHIHIEALFYLHLNTLLLHKISTQTRLEM